MYIHTYIYIYSYLYIQYRTNIVETCIFFNETPWGSSRSFCVNFRDPDSLKRMAVARWHEYVEYAGHGLVVWNIYSDLMGFYSDSMGFYGVLWDFIVIYGIL